MEYLGPKPVTWDQLRMTIRGVEQQIGQLSLGSDGYGYCCKVICAPDVAGMIRAFLETATDSEERQCAERWLNIYLPRYMKQEAS